MFELRKLIGQQITLSILRGRAEGFSVIESIIVIAITAILVSTALPDFVAISASFNRREALEIFVADLRRARLEAVAGGARVIVDVNTSGDGYTVGIDRIPYSSTQTPDASLFVRNLPSNINIGTVSQLIFDSRGYLVNATGIPTSLTASLDFNGSSYSTVSAYSSGTFKVNTL
jgi:Tfp pilus assembly protein FimT